MSTAGLHDLLIQPFADFGFMRRAIVGCLALSLGAGSLGVVLRLRRMSLVGDAMSHALLPGVALGYLFWGLSLPAMTLGGLGAGLLVAAVAGAVTRLTGEHEDASFAAFYLISLALGVLLMSLRGSNVDLLSVLFGSALSLDDPTLLLASAIATLSLVGLAAIYRPLLVECVDPGFLRARAWQGWATQALFLLLLVLNLVGGFYALGTLMAVAFLILPAATARLWLRSVAGQMAVAAAVGLVASLAGLLLSFHLGTPASPAIVLTAGALYAASLLVGRYGSLRERLRHHLSSASVQAQTRSA
ncbi:MAG: Manganese transport system membrane protein MntB [Paracidovorax wautersii]|uniref:Manganese transport system membrane protein MntB n=1 Tax=Paracidovorax wautersii TaxID=1177982 RepID=A0A7V8JPD8_9BURK|nr:MAG: Manganese transport system membrane protein MntB [Paracidovorax wautersii]